MGFEPTCPERTTAFRVRLVMTTSILLHIHLLVFAVTPLYLVLFQCKALLLPIDSPQQIQVYLKIVLYAIVKNDIFYVEAFIDRLINEVAYI